MIGSIAGGFMSSMLLSPLIICSEKHGGEPAISSSWFSGGWGLSSVVVERSVCTGPTRSETFGRVSIGFCLFLVMDSSPVGSC